LPGIFGDTVLLLANASYRFPNASVPALDGVSLSVRAGERVAVLGPNGSGKSTLLRVMCARLLAGPGTMIELDGRSIDLSDSRDLTTLRSSVGCVGQDPDDQLVCTTVFSEVAFGPCNLGLPEEEVRTRTAQALEACDLAGLAQADVATLSGGQRQRACVAGILAMHPSYLLLDEPCSMLDAAARASLLRVIDRIAARGAGIVQVTHELEDVLEYDRVIILSGGRVSWEGTPVRLLEDAEALDASRCLTTPRLLAFARFVRKRGLARDGALTDGLRMRDLEREFLDSGVSGDPPEPAAPGDRVRQRFAGGIRAEKGAASRHGDAADAGASGASTGTEACTSPEASVASADCMFSVVHVSHSYELRPPKARTRKRSADERERAWLDSAALALDDVSLSLSPGSLWVVTGATGSGKTTLLRIAAGLIRPSCGSVLLKGASVEPGDVACSFQRPQDQLFADTVIDDVAFGPRNRGMSRRDARESARHALAKVGLDPDAFADRSPFALSGGQMRRVALAGVLALSSPVLLLDEPSVGLDADGFARLLELVGSVRRTGTAVVIVTHDVRRIAAGADGLVVLSKGRIALCVRNPSQQDIDRASELMGGEAS
jgi:energy-coupling factor transporter ATP-binding protein EcfA2